MARELSKRLTSSEITSRYLWSTKWLECLPPFEEGENKVSFKAVDRDGWVWEFTCSKRPNGPYRKPVIDGSTWLPFVRYKGLAAGDWVTFHYNPDKEGPIKFKIESGDSSTSSLWAIKLLSSQDMRSDPIHHAFIGEGGVQNTK